MLSSHQGMIKLIRYYNLIIIIIIYNYNGTIHSHGMIKLSMVLLITKVTRIPIRSRYRPVRR